MQGVYSVTRGEVGSAAVGAAAAESNFILFHPWEGVKEGVGWGGCLLGGCRQAPCHVLN